MTTEAEYREMVESFRSLVADGSLPKTALIQVAFEQGVSVDKARQALRIVLGDLNKFAAKVQKK